MAISQILQIALLVLAVVAAATFLAGFAAGVRTQEWRRTGGAIAFVSFALYLVIVGGSQPLASRVGPAVSERASLITTAIVAALVGGFGAGIKRRHGSVPGFIVYIVLTALIESVVLGQFSWKNRQVADAAEQLGIGVGRPAQRRAEPTTCPDNLKHIYAALAQYASDWDALPPAATWMDNPELSTLKAHPEWLRCPAVPAGKGFGYALNDSVAGKLGGKSLAQQPRAAATPLVYDSSDISRSAHDAFRSLPAPGKHNGKDNVLYMDGHVAGVVGALQ